MENKHKLASFLADKIKIYNDGRVPTLLATDIYDLLIKFEESQEIK